MHRNFYQSGCIKATNPVDRDLGIHVKWRMMEFKERDRGKIGDANKGGNVKLVEEIRRQQTRLEALELNRQ